jgi:hypothetical protein
MTTMIAAIAATSVRLASGFLPYRIAISAIVFFVPMNVGRDPRRRFAAHGEQGRIAFHPSMRQMVAECDNKYRNFRRFREFARRIALIDTVPMR